MSVGGPGRKLLLIDEDPVLLRGYAQRLRGDGWDVVTAEDGYQAVAAAQGGPWNLILLGMRIPLRGAVDVVRKLRQRKDTAETPIWVLSQAGDSDMVERALREGADGVLDKAKLAPRDIVAEIERVLDARRRSGPSKTRVIESAVPAAVDEIARRLRNPEAAARAAEQATGTIGPNATSRVNSPTETAAVASGATGAVSSGRVGASVGQAAGGNVTGSASGRYSANASGSGHGNATGRVTGSFGGGATGRVSGHLTGRVGGAAPRTSAPAGSGAVNAGGANANADAGGGASGWSAGPHVRRSGATSLPRAGSISHTGVTSGGATSARIPRTGDSRTGVSQTDVEPARGDAASGDITTSLRVGALPGRGRRPVIPASAAIPTFTSPAAAAASAAFDAAMSQPAAAFDVMLNRLVGQAAGLAGSLGLPVDFLCPVCDAKLVLRLSPDPAVENGVHGHFYCGRCTGPR